MHIKIFYALEQKIEVEKKNCDDKNGILFKLQRSFPKLLMIKVKL